MSWLDWDHNAFYHRLLLRQLPQPCSRVLDVGCGAGGLAVELARHARLVDAMDRSPTMIEMASRVTPRNVTCILADVMRAQLPAAGYDAIVSISALHHLPLDESLHRLTAALRPGGVLAVVALPRRDLRWELPVEFAAAGGHRVLGAAFAALRASGRGSWYARPPSNAIMPVVLDPALTTREVRQRADRILPGVQVRRLVYWRYFLRWQRPIAPANVSSP